jgi:hypothetical protein
MCFNLADLIFGDRCISRGLAGILRQDVCRDYVVLSRRALPDSEGTCLTECSVTVVACRICVTLFLDQALFSYY